MESLSADTIPAGVPEDTAGAAFPGPDAGGDAAFCCALGAGAFPVPEIRDSVRCVPFRKEGIDSVACDCRHDHKNYQSRFFHCIIFFVYAACGDVTERFRVFTGVEQTKLLNLCLL